MRSLFGKYASADHSVIPSLPRDLGSAEKRTSIHKPTALPRFFDFAQSRSAQNDWNGACANSPSSGNKFRPDRADNIRPYGGIHAVADAPEIRIISACTASIGLHFITF